MTIDELEHFRNLLIEREHNVVDWVEHARTLSSTDVNKAKDLLDQIRSALTRVEDHSFGTCRICRDSVESHRLEVQPLLDVCLGCMSKDEITRLESDLVLANRVYRALLPQRPLEISGFDIHVVNAEAHYVGGDYYDLLPPCPESGLQRLVVADTMGKGLPAGLLMSNIQGAFRLLAESHASPADLIGNLNRWLCRNIPVTKFVSLVCLGVENGQGSESRIIYSNAGHCSPLLIRKSGEVELLTSTGPVIGVRDDFEYTQVETAMHSGDMVVLYTDGVIEAINQDRDEFGEKRLTDFISPRRSHDLKTLLPDLITHVKAFALMPQLADDYVVMAMRKK